MASIREEWARLQFLMEKGRGEEKVHVVFVEEEAKERLVNTKQKTRIAWDCGDPQTFKAFHGEKERYIGVCGGNTSLATDLMIIVLKLHPDEEIKRYMEALESVNRSAQNP